MKGRGWWSLALIGALVVVGVGMRTGILTSPFARSEPQSHWVRVAATPARLVFEARLDSLDRACEQLDSAIAGGSADDAQRAFRQARSAYKRVEGLVEFYAEQAAGVINGPVPGDDGDAPPRPLGTSAAFQTVESALFPKVDVSQRDALHGTIAGVRVVVGQLRATTAFLAITDSALLDAARIELARVTTLGLAGVDADQSGDAVVESATALDGMRELLAAGRPSAMPPALAAVDTTLGRASEYLRAHPGFERLDRLTFIVDFAQPAGRAIARARAAAGAPDLPRRLAWRASAATVFDSDAFDGSAYAPEYAPLPATPALVALGRRLFFDPRLSGPQTRSCASCHSPARAFTDGVRLAPALAAGAPGHGPPPSPAHARFVARNAPTLLNAGYQPALFADQRAGSLEEQVAFVLASAAEMGGSDAMAASRLRGDASYRVEFARALAGRADSAVTAMGVRVALAAYVRSLSALNSPFDKAVRGDTGAMSAEARRGFTVFMGRGRCATCHFVPLFNGTVPPTFEVSEPEIIGVPATLLYSGARVDPDSGVGGIDHLDAHVFAFKVPTLRNIALTAPYMHNGIFATLDQVIDFYDRGGGLRMGENLPTQTLPARPLHLTATERRELEAFLHALTDTTTSR